MKLYEFQAKEIFANHGIPVPRGEVAETPDQAAAAAERLGGRVVVKAQVHAGGRGLAGFVKVVAGPAEAREYTQWMLGRSFKGLLVNRALVEEVVDKQTEYYVSVTIDRTSKRPVLIGSAKGGMEIEKIAEEDPEAIAKLAIDPAYGPFDFQLRSFMETAGFDSSTHRGIAPIVRKLYEIAVECDASLVEINPLMITVEGRVIAADAKFEVDDNALFRQKSLAQHREESEEDPIEAEAHSRGVTYVRLEGDIGIIGNGAGLVMTTLDLVTRLGKPTGHTPANFLDIGGGAQANSVKEALEIVLMDPNVKGILFNIFGGITRGDEVAKGILAGTSTMDIKVPIVVRMAGTRSEEGRKLLEGTNLTPAATPIDAAKKIIELVGER